MIPNSFITHVSNVLGGTNTGFSGSQIAELCLSYSIDFDVEIPYPTYPFPRDLPNKRTALRRNFEVFSPEQQYKAIYELCDHKIFEDDSAVRDLKSNLVARYGKYSELIDYGININLVEETKHWLKDYPESLKLLEGAEEKLMGRIFQRNLLDDLRLALETLLKGIFDNNKSLENQITNVGNLIKQNKGSKELTNMFLVILKYYCNYQNEYVKHNDLVKENEIDVIFEMTCSFMKYFLKLL